MEIDRTVNHCVKWNKPDWERSKEPDKRTSKPWTHFSSPPGLGDRNMLPCPAFLRVIWTQILALAQPVLYSVSHFLLLFFFNVLCRACLLFGYSTQHSVALVESVWCTVFWSLLPSNDRLHHTPQAVLSEFVQIYSVTFAQGQKSPNDATLSTKPSRWLHVANRGARMMPLPLALADRSSESVTSEVTRC